MSPPGPRNATVDAAACVVHVDGQRRPFSIDLATGAVTLGSGSGATTIEPLTWREKLTLARFVRSDGRLLASTPIDTTPIDAAPIDTTPIDTALLAHKLTGEDDSPVRQSAEGRALVALARWVNGFGPDGGAAPLEPRLLSRIGTQARQAGGLSPADLDRMPAVEVELLVDALSRADTHSEQDSEEDDGVTRIVVLPDPELGQPSFNDGQGAGTVPAAPVPRIGDLPYLGLAPLAVGRSVPQPTGRSARGGSGRAGAGDADWLPTQRPGPDPGPMPTVSRPGAGRPPPGRHDGDAVAPRPHHGERQPAPDRETGPRSGPSWWSSATSASQSPGGRVTRSAKEPAEVPDHPATGPRGLRSAQPQAAWTARPDRTAAPTFPVFPGVSVTSGLPAPNPVASRPSDSITVPAAPVPFLAATIPGSWAALAGTQVDQVLDELAQRLEQAVEDLGLDGEE